MRKKESRKDIPNGSGVYKITNVVNGKFYIGSTYNLRGRWSQHKSKFRNHCKDKSKLKAAWNKYGEESFIYEVVMLCPVEYLIKLEQWFIDTLNPPYNTRKEACASNKGVHHSADTKEKLRKNSKRVWKEKNGWLSEQNKKQIICYSKEGVYIREYDSIKAAAADLGIWSTSITRVVKGINYIVGEYTFRYKTSENYPMLINVITNKDVQRERLLSTSMQITKRVEILIQGESKGTYESIKKAAETLNIGYTTLSAINTGRIYKSKCGKSKYDGYKVIELKES